MWKKRAVKFNIQSKNAEIYWHSWLRNERGRQSWNTLQSPVKELVHTGNKCVSSHNESFFSHRVSTTFGQQ